MKRILLPTDFSENAKNAIRHAVQMYGDEEVTFILFHTFFTPHTSPDASKKVIESEKQDAFEQFDLIIDELNHDHPSLSLDFNKVFKYGSFNKTIREVIDDLDIDMIVMGTQGASGLEEVLIGSSTSEVIGEVSCPVLAVPQESSFVKPKQIVLSLESKCDELEQTIRPLLHIARKFDSEIHVLHVSNSEGQTIEKAVIDEALSDTSHQYHTIESQNIPEVIDEFVQDRKAELLGMITHDRNLFQQLFHKSVSRKLVLHTKLPLLAMRSIEI